MPDPYVTPMAMLGKLGLGVALAAAAIGSAGTAAADRPGRNARPAASCQLPGELPTQEIVGRVIAMMRDSKYLGFFYDCGSHIYTFRFMRNGKVISLDVDGRTGRIVRRSGG